MKFLKFPSIICFILLLFTLGCKKKFEDYSINKNLPLQVAPGLILPSILNDMVVFPGGGEPGWRSGAYKYSQFSVTNYNYYGDNKYWSGSTGLNYGSLRNVLAMEAEAKRVSGSDNNPYHALGLFFRSFFFINMTEKVGDLPMTDALKRLDDPSPKYDSQKDIFKQSLLWLDTANALLAKQIPLLKIDDSYFEFSGDFYFKEKLDGAMSSANALIKWQKVINSFKLRVLIELSKREEDTELNIKQDFAKIIDAPDTYPIFTDNSDNLQYVYNDKYNYYTDNPSNYGNQAGRLNIASTLQTNLGQWHDLRAMIFGEPARGLGFSDTSYNSFVGGKPGDDVSVLATLSGAGLISTYNYNFFYTTYAAEPTLILSYPEVCYCIAEAANRGWITTNAEDWYKKGTIGMYAFYGLKDGDNQVIFSSANGNGSVSYTVHFSFDDYFNQPLVKYKGNNPGGLTQILMEKYFAYARNSGLQGYYQWRRTGVPAFSTGTGIGNGGKIPLRYQYPSNEITTNGANLSSALQSQYGGNDDINGIMWLIK